MQQQDEALTTLPSVPNVWDDVATHGGGASGSESHTAPATQDGNDPDTTFEGLAPLVDNDADYAHGGDDPDMEHDAMMLILHAMQARSSEPERPASEPASQRRWYENPNLGRAGLEANNPEQYFREMEAAEEADFINGAENSAYNSRHGYESS